MSESSTTELEREAELRRAEMTETAERLRTKLSPGQLLDEVAHTFRGGDLSTTFGNLKSQIRDNPLALTLIGAGIACMAAGVPGAASKRSPHRSGGSGSGVGDAASSALAGAQGMAGDVRDNVSAAGSAVGDALSSGASTLSGMAQDTGDLARDVADGARDTYRSVEDEVAGMLQREPLVIGAIGLAIGAAIGALLPETRFEEKHLGKLEDEIKRGATQAAGKAADAARDVAAAAGHAALDEADRQGIVTDEQASSLEASAGKAVDAALGEAGSGSGPRGSVQRPSSSAS
jgi:hypothetical protein